MKHRKISGKPWNLCASLSSFPSPFCFAYSPAGSWTRPRFHNLLSGISNINKLEIPRITSKTMDGPEKQNKWKWFIFICSYRSSMITTLWDKRGRVKAGTSPQTRERASHTKWQRERKLPVFFFMQSHSKGYGKYAMFCNDITCAQNWTQVCHIYPA